MRPLIERRFRANPCYELFLREQSVDRDGAPLPIPPPGKPLYGYLRPKPSSQLICRAISPDTALLFLTLQREGLVPDYFRSLFGGRTDNQILRLVLDGILEVEHEGAFVSGPNARSSLIGDSAYSGKGPIAALSIEALRYVEALGDLSVTEMTRRLYGFGRRPVTSAQKRAFDRAGIEPFGGVLKSAPLTLEKYWAVTQSANPHWVMWRPRRNNDDGEAARFKLYVSPALGHVPEAFAESAELLAQSAGVRALKLGRGLPGLTRPDKLVAYFSRLDDLQEAGTSLYRRLQGCPVHGVPFTAELSPDGLLSWGADRPRTTSGQPESWRLWIACRLAAHFDTARRADISGPLWRFVLDRLRLDGLNPDMWAPTAEFWSSPAFAT
jgi:hypothetical protein